MIKGSSHYTDPALVTNIIPGSLKSTDEYAEMTGFNIEVKGPTVLIKGFLTSKDEYEECVLSTESNKSAVEACKHILNSAFYNVSKGQKMQSVKDVAAQYNTPELYVKLAVFGMANNLFKLAEDTTLNLDFSGVNTHEEHYVCALELIESFYENIFENNNYKNLSNFTFTSEGNTGPDNTAVSAIILNVSNQLKRYITAEMAA